MDTTRTQNQPDMIDTFAEKKEIIFDTENVSTLDSPGTGRSFRLNFRQHRARFYAKQLRLRFQRENVVVFNTCRSPERVLRDQISKNEKVVITIFNLPPHRKLFNPENLHLILDKLVDDGVISTYSREPVTEIKMPVDRFYNSRVLAGQKSTESIEAYTLDELATKVWDDVAQENTENASANDLPLYGLDQLLVSGKVYHVYAGAKAKDVVIHNKDEQE